MGTIVSTSARKRLAMTIETECWRLAKPFRITGYTVAEQDVVVVTLDDGTFIGRGEAAGVYYHGDDPDILRRQIEAVRAIVEAGVDRETLRSVLPPGGARNAIDCALWDLEAKQSGRPAWDLAGLPPLRPLMTTYTLGADDPDAMAAGAVAFADAHAIKLKLTGEPIDAERVRQVRAVRPDVWLSVDGNQGFDRDMLDLVMPALIEARVALLEQPFPLDRDVWLDGLKSPIPIAADESVQGLGDVWRQRGRADVVNIKLDKCGGLTEALLMADEARRLGLGVMVGNMLGTVLAMAPAFVVGQLCDIVDLDGPMPMVADRDPPIVYQDGNVWCPPAAWGFPVDGGRA